MARMKGNAGSYIVGKNSVSYKKYADGTIITKENIQTKVDQGQMTEKEAQSIINDSNDAKPVDPVMQNTKEVKLEETPAEENKTEDTKEVEDTSEDKEN